jgi:hypothetical protein
MTYYMIDRQAHSLIPKNLIVILYIVYLIMLILDNSNAMVVAPSDWGSHHGHDRGWSD